MNKTLNKKRVLVGLSGGVDSSVSCALLKEQGFSVEAVFVKVWQPDFIECNWRDEMRDAMRVCAQLEIPFHFLDLEKEYKTEVVDYFISEYKKGNTPNPDIMCNKYMKFGHLFDYAMERGFDYVATGHYARIIEGKLFRGDPSTPLSVSKDQSYFLWTLKKEKLEKILFPIGNIGKSEVRRVAEKYNLFNADKKDSQGVCILGPINMKDFLKKYADVKKGDVLNIEGKKIGTHDGSILYTIGERHGFKIDKDKKGIEDDILYVVSKDIKNNTITVAKQKEVKSKNKEVRIKDVSFVYHEQSGKIDFQTRHRQKPQKGILENKDSEWFLKADFFELPAEGQSVVFYRDDECLGGGIIS